MLIRRQPAPLKVISILQTLPRRRTWHLVNPNAQLVRPWVPTGRMSSWGPSRPLPGTPGTTAHQGPVGRPGRFGTLLALTPFTNGIRREYPSVILESSWSESETQLINDTHRWPYGTGGAVKVVILCKAFAPNVDNRVKVTLSMCQVVPGV
ncbi:hypothetical protein HOY82DRAFT_666323 [Tuber indicum]|nr:hypothetical protein HOY82DRAFT_666323 [Tuber indicum]